MQETLIDLGQDVWGEGCKGKKFLLLKMEIFGKNGCKLIIFLDLL